MAVGKVGGSRCEVEEEEEEDDDEKEEETASAAEEAKHVEVEGKEAFMLLLLLLALMLMSTYLPRHAFKHSRSAMSLEAMMASFRNTDDAMPNPCPSL